jgi:hypothetical protein
LVGELGGRRSENAVVLAVDVGEAIGGVSVLVFGAPINIAAVCSGVVYWRVMFIA